MTSPSVVDEQLSVARFLADMVEREAGEERANVLTVLMSVVEELGDEVQAIVGHIAGALETYLDEQPFREEHLSGALDVAVRADADMRARLLDSLFSVPELLGETNRISHAASLLDRLPAQFVARVKTAVAEGLADNAEAVLDPLRRLPRDAARSLVKDEVTTALVDRARNLCDEGREEDAAAVGQSLAEALFEREDGPPADLGGDILWILVSVERPALYAVARAHGDGLATGLQSGQGRNSIALRALAQAPPDDWAYWAERIDPTISTFPAQAGWAVGALTAVLNRFREANPALQAAVAGIARQLDTFVRAASEDEQNRLADVITQVLGGEDWRTDAAARERQTRLHEAIRPLTESETAIAERIRDAMLGDLRRGSTLTPGIDREEAVAGLSDMGSRLRDEQRRALASEAAALAADGSIDGLLASLRVRLALAAASAVRGGGEEDGPFAFSNEELTQAADAANPAGDRAISFWFELDPPIDQALIVLGRLGARTPSSLTDAVSQWAERLEAEDRTRAAIGLVEREFDAAGWVEAIARHGLDDEAVVSEISSAVAAATHGDRRAELVESLVALQPTAPRGQRGVADLMIALLETGKKNDFNAALSAARALGQQHRSAERLKKALKAATENHGHRIPKKAAEALAAAGVKPAKKSFRDGAFDRFRDLFR